MISDASRSRDLVTKARMAQVSPLTKLRCYLGAPPYLGYRLVRASDETKIREGWELPGAQRPSSAGIFPSRALPWAVCHYGPSGEEFQRFGAGRLA